MKIIAALAAASALAAFPAVACDIATYDPSMRIDTAALPAVMVGEAAWVDVAVAEAVEPADVDAWLDRAWAGELARADETERARIAGVRQGEAARYKHPDFGRIRYRVEETLKGAPQDSFTLMGFLYSEGSDKAQHYSQFDRTGQRGDYSDPKEVYLSGRLVQGDVVSGWGCESSFRAVQGRRYLIFRDAAGNLLGEIRSPERRYAGYRHAWPVYEEMLPNDPWLARVRKAARKAR